MSSNRMYERPASLFAMWVTLGLVALGCQSTVTSAGEDATVHETEVGDSPGSDHGDIVLDVSGEEANETPGVQDCQANSLFVLRDIAVLPFAYNYNNSWNWQCQHSKKSAGDRKRSGDPGSEKNPLVRYSEKNLITSSS